MSLRRSVFLAVLLVVLCTTAMEAVLDVLLDRFQDQRLLLDLLDVPLTVAIAGVGAWVLARRIARPLKRLTEAARHVAAQAPAVAPLEADGQDELAELVAGFNEMTVAVEGYVERERAFTRYASHELRTPLSAMRLQLERVELGHAPAESVLPSLTRSVAQLEEIMAALLSLAREAGPTSAQRASAMLDEVISTLPPADRRRMRVHDGAAGVQIVHARLFHRALANLVDNALRHGSGATVVALETGDGRLKLRVHDEGPGLPDEVLERVTEPFYRGPGSGAEDGQGLGLSFVAFVARALEGDLRLANLGGGLVAELSLPIIAEPAPA